MTLTVFTDASSAILLEKIEIFDDFSAVFKVVLTASVFDEITRPGYQGAAFFQKAFQAGQIDVVNVSEINHSENRPENNEMGLGERDTIRLFLERKQGFILTDDGKAAIWCKKYGLPFINALLVPKIFWYSGLMDEKACQKKMETLCQIGRYSQKIREIAFLLDKKDLAFFIPENKNDPSLF